MMRMTPAYRQQLLELGVETPIKALYFFPKSSSFIEPAVYDPSLEAGTFIGTIMSKPTILRTGKSMFVRFTFETNGYTVPVICFNQSFLTKVLTIGMQVAITAKKAKRNWVASKVYYKDIEDIGVETKYALLKGMQQSRFKKYIAECLKLLQVENFIPDELHTKYKLLDRKTAFLEIHMPTTPALQQQAIRYFKYEEAFIFQLNLAIRKSGRQEQVVKEQKLIDMKQMVEAQKQLPYELTGAQTTVLQEIVDDFQSEKIMHRLVQGDVGSGKTVVAMLAAFLQIKAGFQVAVLAPTTILAEQHYQNMRSFLEAHHIVVGFLRSQMTKKERDIVLEALVCGDIDLIIGTHALLEEDVYFHKLGLAIIDEQQRFGVEQRKKLRNKSKSTEMLYMTATPIPRTMAMTVFGDLDVSTIDELPSGRKPIHTEIVRKKDWKRIISAITDTVGNKQQAYVVVPLIEESETMDVAALEQIYQKLSKTLDQSIRIGILHGKQKNEDKQIVLDQFSQGAIDVLISTTVVEVGVHVDNATLMVIIDAQQFGLSQLHQLRGRIGRNALSSTCLLYSDAQTERLQLLEQSQDGFYLSQEDLKLRGPGDFFGEKQSGLPTFQLLNVVEDFNVLDCARVDVAHILSEESSDKKYEKINQYINRKKKEITDYLA